MAQFIDFGDRHDGSATGKSGTLNTYASMTGSAGSTTVTTALSVNVGDVVLLHQSRGTANVGKWEVVRVVATGSGSFTAHIKLVNTYASVSQAVLIPQYSAGTISGAVTATSWNGTSGGIIALLCNGALTISGSLTINGVNGSVATASSVTGASGGGYIGGTAVRRTSANYSYSGYGTAGAQALQYTANGNGGGGAYVTGDTGQRQPGGGGGNGTAGDDAGWKGTLGQYGGYGGNAVGSSSLTTMFFGGGGGGCCLGATANESMGSGASGAGIILVIAKELTLSGTMSVNGGTGGQGNPITLSGGSGAGGSVLIKAQTATLGANKITATGGSKINGEGGGGVGRIRLDYKLSYSGSTNPTMSVAQDTTLNNRRYAVQVF